MRIYIAAPFKHREKAREWASLLAAAGHEITSSWLWTMLDDDDYERHWKREAVRDLTDVRRADLLVLMAVNESGRGGCLMEFAYALGQGIPCVTVGDKPWMQFLTLAQEHFDTFEALRGVGPVTTTHYVGDACPGGHLDGACPKCSGLGIESRGKLDGRHITGRCRRCNGTGIEPKETPR